MSDLAIETSAEPAAPAAAEPAAEPVDPLAAGAAAGDATGVEPAAAPAAPTPAEHTLDPVEVQAQLEYLSNAIAERDAVLQQLAAGQPTQQPTGPDLSGLVDEFGSINPEAFASFLQDRDKGLLEQIGQMFAPLQQTFAQQAEAERHAAGEENLTDILSDDIARNGEFASDPNVDKIARDRVRQRAEAMFPEIAGQYGPTARAAELAMVRAAAEERDYLRAIGVQATTVQANHLATLAGAAAEPGAGAAGGVPGAPEFKSPREVVEFYANNARNL